MIPSEPSPFRGLHRRAAAHRAVRGALWGSGVLAVAAFAWILPTVSAVPAPVPVSNAQPIDTAAALDSAVRAAPTSSPLDTAAVAPGPIAGPGRAALPAAPEAPIAAAPPVPAPERTPRDTGARAIRIDTTGYQTELDACDWVRMDLRGATAPIVGKHLHCGGGVILELAVGDRVDLSGERLDGRYAVTGDRTGHPGQSADEATRDLRADVILQTCYPGGATVRLVGLTRLPA